MALCWLVFAIFLCVLIAILLSSKKFHGDDKFELHPQIEMEPHPNTGSLIDYKFDNTKSVRRLKTAAEIVLSPYNKLHLNPWQVECNYGQHDLEENESCAVELKNFGSCSREFGYGYKLASPCFFFKLKKVANWQPSFFTLEELETSGLSGTYLESLNVELEKKNPAFLKSIWVECQGRHMIDQLHLGSVSYHPQRGFPYFYFPYQPDQAFYEEPIVAVQFGNPKSK